MAVNPNENRTDRYYPAILNPEQGLDAKKVDDAMKRAFDFIYQLQLRISALEEEVNGGTP